MPVSSIVRPPTLTPDTPAESAVGFPGLADLEPPATALPGWSLVCLAATNPSQLSGSLLNSLAAFQVSEEATAFATTTTVEATTASVEMQLQQTAAASLEPRHSHLELINSIRP